MEYTTIFPGDLSIADFDYELPKERIANYPLPERDLSKLLVYKNGLIEDTIYQSLPNYIPEKSLMVFNETKVVHARLQFLQTNGAQIEVFCLEPASAVDEISIAMQKAGSVEWRCFVGDFRKWKETILVRHITWEGRGSVELKAEVIRKEEGTFIIRFHWNALDVSFGDILEHAGKVPLPPYIKREAGKEDVERYQTIFGKNEGSVAAPTAGLHYTASILDKLRERSINIDYLTLHVGAGTFKPVKAPKMSEHEMHSEQIILKKSFLKKLLSFVEKDIVAVGTTSARTLESIYWLGVKLYLKKVETDKVMMVDQWDPYTLLPVLSPSVAIQEVIAHLDETKEDILIARTKIIIAPGYQWKLVKVLATNFHQPKSTLILLVASFIGKNWRNIYSHALGNDYRFLSYGDGCLLFK